MADPRASPRAVVWLDLGLGRRVRLTAIDRSTRCDLGLVDDLLRMRLLATRAGWTIEITDVCDELRALFDLVGVSDQLGASR